MSTPKRKQRLWTAEEIAADPTFPHGENRGRDRGCPCDRCREAHNALRRQDREALRRVRGLGPDDLVPAGRVHAHLDRLVADGYSLGTIARTCGLHKSTLHQARRNTRVTVRVARLALAVTADAVLRQAPLTALVSSKRATQQVRSMQALGYTGRWIASRLGYTNQTGPAFILQRREQITVEVAQRVDALAREIGYTWGPSAQSRRRAAAAGWFGPAAYDEHGDLLPGAQPLVA